MMAQDPELERAVYKLLDAARRPRDNFRKKQS
jgi:hypothetical protein